jgi:CRP-like cAMP-binding protein
MKHELVKVKAGEFLYQEGEECRTMYLLKQGRMKLVNMVSNQEVDGMIIYGGSVVGELSFFDGQPRESAAKAMLNSTLIAIKYEDMSAQLNAIPAWFSTIINSIVKRVRTTEESVLKASSKNMGMDYSNKDLKTEGYTYIDKNDLLKILNVLSMTAARYSTKGVKSTEVNFDMLKKFVIRFRLGSAKLDAVLKVLEENKMAKLEDLGEGKTKLEIFEIKKIDAMLGAIKNQATKGDLTEDAVMALSALQKYFEEHPVMGNGRKSTNVTTVQDCVLNGERFFLQKTAFQLLKETGFVEFEDDAFMDFSFDPAVIEAFLPAQRILSSVSSVNKEH